MKNIYISGMISGGDSLTLEQQEENKQHFLTAQKFLESNGDCLVFNPCIRTPYNENWKWKDYMLANIELILRGDITHIFMLNNWQRSLGARIELAIAKEMGLVVVYE